MNRKKAAVDSIKHLLTKESRPEKNNAKTRTFQSKSLMNDPVARFQNIGSEAKSINDYQILETQVYTDEASLDENKQDHQEYDEDLMNQIEMEIYESNLHDDSQNDFLRKITDECEQTNDVEESPQEIKTSNKMNSKGAGKIIDFSNSDLKIQKTEKQSKEVTEQEATQITGDSEEEELIIPKKKELIVQSVKFTKQKIPPINTSTKKTELVRQKSHNTSKNIKTTRKNPLDSDKKSEQVHEESCSPIKHSQPSKKLKQDSSSLSQKLINFTVNIKLLNNNEKVERVVKCLDTNRIKDKSEAKFLVILEDSKDYKIMKNDEMLYFYKDAIVDYYQAIHFS